MSKLEQNCANFVRFSLVGAVLDRSVGLRIRRSKVAVVIDPWDYPFNGTVVSTRRFVEALTDQIDFRLLAISNSAESRSAMDSRICGFPKLSIPGFNRIIESMKVPLANPWSKRGAVAASLEGVDLVHMQFPFFLGSAVCRQAKRMGLPLICSFHVQPENLLQNLKINSPLLAKWLYKLFIWGIYRHADLVVTPSEFAASQLENHGLNKPTEVLSNGVPKEFFNLPRHPNQTDLGAKKFKILSVGRMAPEKHHELIFEALSHSKYKERIHLRLIGAGPLEAHLKARINELQLDAELGAASDEALATAYSQSDLFVHAGEVELEGMSVLEAMASGNAVLVSDSKNSAANELVEGQQALFDHRSALDLAAKIDYWIENSELRLAAGDRNRALAAERDHQASVDQLASIYARFTPDRLT